MSENRECQKCGDYYTLRHECEPTAYCDLCAQTMLGDALKQIAQLTKEHDILRKHIDSIVANPPPDVQEKVIQMLDLVHRDAVRAAEHERDQLAAKVAKQLNALKSQDETIFKLSSKVAEMRELLQQVWDDALLPANVETAIIAKFDHALSDQCGTGWLSPEKKKVLVGLIQRCDDHLAGAASFLPSRTEFKQALEACK